MNIVRRVAVVGHGRKLELLLILSVALLIGQLSWPAVVHWWRLPSPGRTGFDTFVAPTLADEFVISLPSQYRKRSQWPLVVFLHGSGERGNDPNVLQQQTLFRRELPAIVVTPQCLPSVQWEPEAVADFIRQIASRYHVDPRRIYLVGYSMGGYGTWATAAIHPELFAAIVPIAGGDETSHARVLAALPIWAFSVCALC